MTDYTARAYDRPGHQAAQQSVAAAEFKRTALLRSADCRGRRPLHGDRDREQRPGRSAPSLASAPLSTDAASALPAAPTSPKLRTAATAATLAWTPPTGTGTRRSSDTG